MPLARAATFDIEPVAGFDISVPAPTSPIESMQTIEDWERRLQRDIDAGADIMILGFHRILTKGMTK